jgi:D-alanyl-lipoteichoic acid acyltransferase DltB (MBOAT superfamily)
MRQILWGLFKKVVIADNCAQIVNVVFENSEDYSGSSLLIGAVLFSFQIYCDFSGYSDIAIGTSRLFGFNLMQNFAFPYFSRDIAEFWRRWHISLSTWFRDYLYIPLGGSQGGVGMKVRNTFIIFLVSGFWHGANWTFIIWGLLNALYIMPSIILNTNRHNIEIAAKGKFLPSFKDFFNILITFSLTVLAWIFFRAESVGHALIYLKGIFNKSLFSLPVLNSNFISIKVLFLLLSFFIIVEWLGRNSIYTLENFALISPLKRRMFYLIILFLIIIYGVTTKTEFIYFAF